MYVGYPLYGSPHGSSFSLFHLAHSALTEEKLFTHHSLFSHMHLRYVFVLAHGCVYQCCQFIFSVHWPGVEVQRKCLPSLLHHSGVQYKLFQPWPESSLKITKRGKYTSLTLSTPLLSSPPLSFFLPEMTNSSQKDHRAITRGERELFTPSGWLRGSSSFCVYMKCIARRVVQ